MNCVILNNQFKEVTFYPDWESALNKKNPIFTARVINNEREVVNKNESSSIYSCK